jgi:hypothetical protein
MKMIGMVEKLKLGWRTKRMWYLILRVLSFFQKLFVEKSDYREFFTSNDT